MLLHRRRPDQPWRPLLTGSDAARALETAREIAVASDALAVASDDVSLSGGIAGHALLFAYLDRACPGEGHGDVACQRIARATAAIGRQRMGPDLFAGFAGVVWALTHIDSMLRPTVADRAGSIDTALAGYVDRSPWRGDYDLVSGLVGLGVYAFERLPRPAAVECLTSVVVRLSELAERRGDHVCWHTAPALLPEHQRAQCADGYYNLGLAHGMPGVIALLGKACSAGVASDVARPLLDGVVSWLLARPWAAAERAGFPAWLPYGASADDPSQRAARVAWCYGDLGLAGALLVAAEITANDEWIAAALRIARRAAERPVQESGVVDAGLCHGAAGVAHIFNRMHQANGDEQLRAAAIAWLQRALDMRVPNAGIAGFRAYAPPGVESRIDDPGLLTGAVGVGLALLAAATDVEPQWDRMLLLS